MKKKEEEREPEPEPEPISEKQRIRHLRNHFRREKVIYIGGEVEHMRAIMADRAGPFHWGDGDCFPHFIFMTWMPFPSNLSPIVQSSSRGWHRFWMIFRWREGMLLGTYLHCFFLPPRHSLVPTKTVIYWTDTLACDGTAWGPALWPLCFAFGRLILVGRLFLSSSSILDPLGGLIWKGWIHEWDL